MQCIPTDLLSQHFGEQVAVIGWAPVTVFVPVLRNVGQVGFGERQSQEEVEIPAAGVTATGTAVFGAGGGEISGGGSSSGENSCTEGKWPGGGWEGEVAPTGGNQVRLTGKGTGNQSRRVECSPKARDGVGLLELRTQGEEDETQRRHRATTAMRAVPGKGCGGGKSMGGSDALVCREETFSGGPGPQEPEQRKLGEGKAAAVSERQDTITRGRQENLDVQGLRLQLLCGGGGGGGVAGALPSLPEGNGFLLPSNKASGREGLQSFAEGARDQHDGQVEEEPWKRVTAKTGARRGTRFQCQCSGRAQDSGNRFAALATPQRCGEQDGALSEEEAQEQKPQSPPAPPGGGSRGGSAGPVRPSARGQGHPRAAARRRHRTQAQEVRDEVTECRQSEHSTEEGRHEGGQSGDDPRGGHLVPAHPRGRGKGCMHRLHGEATVTEGVSGGHGLSLHPEKPYEEEDSGAETTAEVRTEFFDISEGAEKELDGDLSLLSSVEFIPETVSFEESFTMLLEASEVESKLREVINECRKALSEDFRRFEWVRQRIERFLDEGNFTDASREIMEAHIQSQIAEFVIKLASTGSLGWIGSDEADQLGSATEEAPIATLGTTEVVPRTAHQE